MALRPAPGRAMRRRRTRSRRSARASERRPLAPRGHARPRLPCSPPTSSRIASSNGSSPSPVAAETTNGSTPADLGELLRQLGHVLGLDQVGARQGEHFGLVLEPRAIGLELAADDAIGLDRILARGIDQVEQDAACARHGRGSGRRSRRLRRRPRSGRECRPARTRGPCGGPRPAAGASVVKGYSPTLATALVVRLRKVDLPALGRPTSPTSASSFSRSQTYISSPGQPVPCWRGARLVEVL